MIRLLSWVVLAGCASCAGCGGSGGSSAPLPDGPPAIVALTPSGGENGRGVLVSGTRFETDRDLNFVIFGGNRAAVISASSSEIVTQVPPGAPLGPTTVTIQTRAGTSNPAPFDVVSPGGGGGTAPSIFRLVPPAAAPGATVAVEGFGFGGTASGNLLSFAGAVAVLTVAGVTRLETTVPAGATTGDVRVQTAGGFSNLARFFVTSDQAAPQGAPGTRAGDLLAAAPFDSVLIEVDFIDGFPPEPAALHLLAQRIGERCNKPEGVGFVVDDAIPNVGIGLWLRQDIQLLELVHRDHFSSSKTLALYVVYLNGEFEGNTLTRKRIGVPVSGTSIAMFKLAAAGATTQVRDIATVERSVIVHQLGHLLGLVNAGVPMVIPHEDGQHPQHDADRGCVMTFELDTNELTGIVGALPTSFETGCVADLRAAGGR